jgi:hypothetical protein
MRVDDREFAELTKALADGQSRRRIVKILGAGVLSGLAGLVGRGDAEARKRKRNVGAQAVTTTTTTTTKKPTTTTKKPTTTTKKPTTTTKKPIKKCLHSSGPGGGCKGACTDAGFTGQQCNPICGNGQFEGYCPVGQGDGNPCCSLALCDRRSFSADPVTGDPVFTDTDPDSTCPPTPPGVIVRANKG